jgi:hypothetical protein
MLILKSMCVLITLINLVLIDYTKLIKNKKPALGWFIKSLEY